MSHAVSQALDSIGMPSDAQRRLLCSESSANIIFVGYRGSKAHGTYVASENLGAVGAGGEKPHDDDDIDLMSVYIPQIEHYLGFGRPEGGQTMLHKEWDVVNYELRKFVRLLLKSNPNVLTMLWLPEPCIVHQDWQYTAFRAHRALFANKGGIYEAFTGYARGQMKRMTHWHGNTSRLGAKRKALVEKHGYDTKNASQVVRLLCLGIEFLQHGEFIVDRSDPSIQYGRAKELKSIKRGEWRLADVQSYASQLFDEAERAKAQSSLPARPNYERVEQLLVETIALSQPKLGAPFST